MSTLRMPSFRASFACVLALALSGAAPAAEVGNPELDPIWNDPSFQRSIVGGFGISSDVEPRITQDDLALMELVRQLLPDDMKAAEELLRETVRPGGNAIWDLTLAGVLFQQERMEEALANYRIAAAKFPSFRRAYRNIGLICTRQGRFPEAIAAFNKMTELGAADSYSYGLLGYCHTSLQDYQPAEAAYRNALLLQPESVDWRLGLTRSVFKQEKYEDAASLLDVLIATFPDKAEFWLLQAHTYIGLKQPMKAAVNLEALDALEKSTADTLLTLGDIYMSESLPDLALSSYERAIAKNPQQPSSKMLRAAEVLAARGGNEQAMALLTRIKETWGETMSDDDKRKVLKLQARLAMHRGDNSEENAAILEEVIKLDPLDGEALMLLGQHYAKSNDPDKAILFYERAAGIGSYAAPAKVKIAQIYVSQGRFDLALPELREAQTLRPREDVARYIEQVERAAKGKR